MEKEIVHSVWNMIKIITFIGTYTCVAKTQTTGTDTESGVLKVVGIKPSIDGIKETHQVFPEETEIRLFCKIDGDPTPTQTWSKVAINNCILHYSTGLIIDIVLYHMIWYIYFSYLE